MKATNIQWDIDSEDLDSGIVLLPLAIDIPPEITDIDDISDYISGITGYCHKGYALEE